MEKPDLTPRDDLIQPGETAPDFTLLDQDRQEWRLADAVKQGPVVLCFYPLSFTDTCEAEMQCVDNEMDTWQAKGASVVGISCDSFAVQKAWANQMRFQHRLLADMHRQVCRAYGLYWPELNVAKRGTVVLRGSDSGEGVVKWSQAREPGNAMEWAEVVATI